MDHATNHVDGSSSLGLIVTAKQTYYPIELSNAELLAHYETVQDYHQEISMNCITQSCRLKPDAKLIDQQPELDPRKTRHYVVNFFFELALKTRVTNGIFYQSVRLYDRYCSKRIVLREQVKLVVATCLWLAAKTWGGCNHIINNVSVPTGGRFYGPNPRARIPRLSELIHLCNDSQTFDESMFTQMERHILNTLGWEIYEPMINDYILNADENCSIQYELYKRQLEHNRKWLNNKDKDSSANKESDSTDEEQELGCEADEEDDDLTQKIQLINVKKFLIDLTSWQYVLLKFEQFEITHGMFQLINKFTNQELGPLLQTPIPAAATSDKIVDIYIDAILDCPEQLWEHYKEFDGVAQFIGAIKDYQRQLEYLSQQKQMQYSTPTRIYQVPSAQQNFPSPPYSQQNFSPSSSRKVSTQSDNSLFSTYATSNSSPLTPQLHSFTHNKLTPSSANSNSQLSLHSTNTSINRTYEDKENIDPASMATCHKVNSYIVPPRAKFVGQSSSVFSSGGSISNGNSNRSSLISLSLGNTVVSMK